MATFPHKPDKILSDLNMRYFGGELPPITVRFVEDLSEGFLIDTRCDLAGVLRTSDGWQMEVNQGLQSDPRHLYLTMAHECLHVRLPDEKHNSKKWNHEVRRLQGLGLFLRIF